MGFAPTTSVHLGNAHNGTASSTACSATSPRPGAQHCFTSRLAVVELIANTTTKTGLTVRCKLDTNTYPKGLKVSDDDMATLDHKRNDFYPDWNYTVSPRLKMGR
jgi:hypothetical protein